MAEYEWDEWRQKAKEEGGGNDEAVVMPDGTEVQAIVAVSKAGKTAKQGDKISLKFNIVEGAFEGEHIWHTLNFPASGNQAKFFFRTIEALGVKLEGSSTPEQVASAILAAKKQVTLVTQNNEETVWKGKAQSKVQYVNAGRGTGEDDEEVEDGFDAPYANSEDTEDLPF